MTTQPKDSTYYTEEQKRGEMTPGGDPTNADADSETDPEDEDDDKMSEEELEEEMRTW